MTASGLRESGRAVFLSTVAVVCALAFYLMLGYVYWGVVYVGFSLPFEGRARNVVAVVLGLAGIALAGLFCRSMFRAVEFLLGRRPIESVAFGAVGGAVLGIALGLLVLSGGDAKSAQAAFTPVVFSLFSAFVGIWLQSRANARRRQPAV